MKKALRVLSIIIVCCFFSNCIDIYHHVTKDSNFDHNTLKITVSKVVLEMANSMSSNVDPINYDEWLEEMGEIQEYDQFNASIEKINDVSDIGCLLKMNINYKDKDMVEIINQEKIEFIPKYVNDNMVIAIPALNKSGVFDDNEITMAFLSIGKYRLSVSKTCIGNIERVTLTNSNSSKEADITYIDMNDEYLVEIPILCFFNEDIILTLYQN
jgi:hypothetical protein